MAKKASKIPAMKAKVIRDSKPKGNPFADKIMAASAKKKKAKGAC